MNVIYGTEIDIDELYLNDADIFDLYQEKAYEIQNNDSSIYQGTTPTE